MSNAFNEALALESVGELGVFDASTGTYSGVTSDALAKYARTVAYKVFHNLKHGHTMSKEDDPLTVDGVSASEAWAHNYEAASEDAILTAMVNRFLAWKLPEDFAPDAGISFNAQPYQTPSNPHWPTGTNLLNAGQALEMFKHCLPVELIAPNATGPYFIELQGDYPDEDLAKFKQNWDKMTNGKENVWNLESAPDHQCCGKCITDAEAEQPVDDIDPITKSAYERTIQDLARRLMTADSLIVSLVTAAGGEVTITDESLAGAVDKMIDSSVSDDKRSMTFRVVAVDLPVVQ